jgi:phosphoribosylformylglycinamidine cyclo-ligase
VLPEGTCARLDSHTWQAPKIFDWLKRHGRIEPAEMHRTFNCGIGMVLVVAKDDIKATLDILASSGVEAWEIGSIAAREAGGPPVVVV